MMDVSQSGHKRKLDRWGVIFMCGALVVNCMIMALALGSNATTGYVAPDLHLTVGQEDYDLLAGITYNRRQYQLSIEDLGGFQIDEQGEYQVTYTLTPKYHSDRDSGRVWDSGEDGVWDSGQGGSSDGVITFTRQVFVDPPGLHYISFDAPPLTLVPGQGGDDLLSGITAVDENGNPVTIRIVDSGGLPLMTPIEPEESDPEPQADASSQVSYPCVPFPQEEREKPQNSAPADVPSSSEGSQSEPGSSAPSEAPPSSADESASQNPGEPPVDTGNSSSSDAAAPPAQEGSQPDEPDEGVLDSGRSAHRPPAPSPQMEQTAWRGNGGDAPALSQTMASPCGNGFSPSHAVKPLVFQGQNGGQPQSPFAGQTARLGLGENPSTQGPSPSGMGGGNPVGKPLENSQGVPLSKMGESQLWKNPAPGSLSPTQPHASNLEPALNRFQLSHSHDQERGKGQWQ